MTCSLNGRKMPVSFVGAAAPGTIKRAMVPWVVPHISHAGDLILMCSGCGDRDCIGRCTCFFKHEFPHSRISELSPETKAEWMSIGAVLSREARPSTQEHGAKVMTKASQVSRNSVLIPLLGSPTTPSPPPLPPNGIPRPPPHHPASRHANPNPHHVTEKGGGQPPQADPTQNHTTPQATHNHTTPRVGNQRGEGRGGRRPHRHHMWTLWVDV